MTKRPRRPTRAAHRSADPNALVAHATVLALNPEVLHEQAEASVRALLKEGESANTVRSYAGALRYWAAWCRLRYRAALALPVPVPAVLQFLVDHVERTGPADGILVHDLPPAIDEALVAGGFKGTLGAPALNTVLHRLSVLSKAHQMRDVTNPTRDPTVQELVRRVRRAYAARGERPDRKTALTRDPLEAMLDTCTDGLVGVRDRALLLFGFASGGRRRSEIANAVLENLVKVDDQTYLYRLTHSKSDQAGTEHNPDADKPITGVAAEALTHWLHASGITTGPIFRRVRKTKAVESLSGQAVGLIVKRRAQLAGLEGDFGAHSLRSGFVTEAGRQNVPIKEAMGLTGHRSLVTFMRYFQTGAVQQTRAANLFGAPVSNTSSAGSNEEPPESPTSR
jgi:integrase